MWRYPVIRVRQVEAIGAGLLMNRMEWIPRPCTSHAARSCRLSLRQHSKARHNSQNVQYGTGSPPDEAHPTPRVESRVQSSGLRFIRLSECAHTHTATVEFEKYLDIYKRSVRYLKSKLLGLISKKRPVTLAGILLVSVNRLSLYYEQNGTTWRTLWPLNCSSVLQR
jgi:hypothetical protein